MLAHNSRYSNVRSWK